MLLGHLRTPVGHEAAVSDPTQCAALLALLVEDTELVDTLTAEPVEEADVDWSTENDPERQPAEGTRHADTGREKTVLVPEYYCRDPRASGLTLVDFRARAQRAVRGFDGPASVAGA